MKFRIVHKENNSDLLASLLSHLIIDVDVMVRRNRHTWSTTLTTLE